MAIGPLEFQGAIPRVQDYASIRQNEDSKGATDQMHATNVVNHETDVKATSVNRQDETSNNHNNFDAREKGSNEYGGDGGKKRKNAEEPAKEGKVIVKGRPDSFDIRI